MMYHEAGLKIGVQLLGGSVRLKFGRAKTSEIPSDFVQLLTLTANMSEKDRAIDRW